MPHRGHPKYQPLTDYLAALAVDEVRLTFPTIEAIIGSGLPASVQKGNFWLNGQPGILRVQPWVRAGWRVLRPELHQTEPAITFTRTTTDATSYLLA